MKCANLNDIKLALVALGMIDDPVQLDKLVTNKGWHRSGSETYLFEFSVLTVEGHQTKYAMKAFTPPSIAEKLESQFQKITAKRELLASHGMPTPKLYSASNAIWLEEWIPTTIDSTLIELMDNCLELEKFADALIQIAELLDSLQFQPIDIFSGLRCKNNLPVMIDFGVDLGNPHVSKRDNYVRSSLLNWSKSKYPKLEKLISDKFILKK